ncbi:MAG: hypothetical protein WAW96_18845, partial [Alphaproteobacteria bacterium]
VNSGAVVTQSSTVTQSGMVQTSALEGALSGIIVIDDFKRAFVADKPHVFSEAPPPRTTVLDDFMGDLSAQTTNIELPDHSRLSFTSSGGSHGTRIVSFNGGDLHYDMGFDASASYFTSAGSSVAGNAEPFSRRMAREFYEGAGDAAEAFDRAMVFSWDLKASSRLTLSGLYLHTAPFAELVPAYVEARMAEDRPQSSLVKFGANYRVSGTASAGIYAGYLGERDHTLGMRTSGAFSLGDGATYVTGATFNADLAPKTSLAAFAEHSTTVNESVANSLFAADQWTGSKFGASLTQKNPLGIGGLVRLRVARSWQIDSGSLNIRVPVGRELDGTVDYETRTISVASDKVPLEFGFAYLGGGDHLKYGAELRLSQGTAPTRQDGGHLALATGVRWSF